MHLTNTISIFQGGFCISNQNLYKMNLQLYLNNNFFCKYMYHDIFLKQKTNPYRLFFNSYSSIFWNEALDRNFDGSFRNHYRCFFIFYLRQNFIWTSQPKPKRKFSNSLYCTKTHYMCGYIWACEHNTCNLGNAFIVLFQFAKPDFKSKC